MFTSISELDIEGGVHLAGDVPVTVRDPTAGGSLHWAPIASPAPAARAKQIVDWIVRTGPCGVVVDVSVEAASLCRLAGVPTIVMRQHGERTDPAHQAAYSSAQRLIAPFPVELEHALTPEWVVAKTDHVGFVGGPPPHSRMDESSDVPTADDIVVLWGTGGGRFDRHDLVALVIAARPGRVWTVGSGIDSHDVDVIDVGWVDEVRSVLANRPVVVASAGNNVVADAATAGCPLVVVPQDRPFDEQFRHAESLDRARVAAVATTAGDAPGWRSSIEQAHDRVAALESLVVGRDGAESACDVIEQTFLPARHRSGVQVE